MKLVDYNAFCQSFSHSEHVVQWGNAHVWKIGGKVFAIGGWSDKDETHPDAIAITFKTSEISYEILSGLSGCRPAPYLASRGMKWIQYLRPDELSEDDVKHYIRESFQLVSSGLSKKKQKELGLI